MIRWQYLTLTAAFAVVSCQGTGESKMKDLSAQQLNNEIKKDTLHKMELIVEPAVFEQKDTVKMGRYVLNNNLDQELVFSSYYTIEKLTDGKWVEAPLNEMLAFEDITYAVQPKKSKEFPLALSRIMKDRATVKGHYRLTKEAWVYKNDADKKQLTAEFEIK